MFSYRLHLRHRRLCCRISALVACGAFTAGCKPDSPSVRVDSATAATSTAIDSSETVPSSNGWNAVAGPVLLVAGPSPDEALVFFGASTGGETSLIDTGAVDQGKATLFGRDGTRVVATLELPAGNDNTACRVWPLRNFKTAAGSGTWSVGFVSDAITAIPLDSVDALPARDSMALAAEASRLASAVSSNTSPAFQGLRFTAHDIRRFEAVPGVQALAAHLTRHVNQEADPQEEQTLLIAERDSGVTAGPYQLVYAERLHGKEEELTTSEVVAAARFGASGRPMLIVARDGNDGLAYALLERSATRQWRVRWTSGMAKCAD